MYICAYVLLYWMQIISYLLQWNLVCVSFLLNCVCWISVRIDITAVDILCDKQYLRICKSNCLIKIDFNLFSKTQNKTLKRQQDWKIILQFLISNKILDQVSGSSYRHIIYRIFSETIFKNNIILQYV